MTEETTSIDAELEQAHERISEALKGAGFTEVTSSEGRSALGEIAVIMQGAHMLESFESFLRVTKKILPDITSPTRDLMLVAYQAGAVAQAEMANKHAGISSEQAMSILAKFTTEAMNARGLEISDDPDQTEEVPQ